MGWRTVVVSKPSKLDLRLGYMVVRDVESNVQVHISVLCIENHRIYRKTVESFYNGCPDESSIVFLKILVL